ncbi:hypothetical protein ABUT89_26860, partial [Escherichia coli]
MVKVININGNLVELPEPSAKLSKAESPDGRFSKPKNKISKIQRAELRMKFGGRCAYCGCKLPEKGWHADHVGKRLVRTVLIFTESSDQLSRATDRVPGLPASPG